MVINNLVQAIENASFPKIVVWTHMKALICGLARNGYTFDLTQRTSDSTIVFNKLLDY